MKPVKNILLPSNLAAALILLIVGFSTVTMGNEFEPSEAHGYTDSGYSLSEIENINLANGNLTLKIPVSMIRTDGGLEYAVSAFYNSKIWGNEWVEGEGEGHYLPYLRGVENFGVGWDLRPPRIRAAISCASGTDFPCTQPEDTEYVLYHWTDMSGATHRLFSVPPVSIEYTGTVDPWAPYQDADGIDEVCAPDKHLDCGCIVEEGDATRVCYTWDEPLLRVTYRRDTAEGDTVTVEDSSGTLYRHDHLVAEHARSIAAGTSGGILDWFQMDLDGFYLTAVEKGPWDATGQPANLISLKYVDYEPSGSELDQSWLPQWIRVGDGTLDTRRSIDFAYDDQSTWELIEVNGPAFSANPTPSVIPRNRVEFSVSVHESAIDGVQFNVLNFVRFNPDGQLTHSYRFQYDDPTVLIIAGLPSGADITYEHGTFPMASSLRGAAAPPLDVFQASGGHKSAGWVGPLPFYCSATTPALFNSDAIVKRTIAYPSPGIGDQVESTVFAHNINCFIGDVEYPYESELVEGEFLDEVLADVIAANRKSYNWTWVQTYAGDGDPNVEGTIATAEVHRFHPRSFREFSVDVLDTFLVEGEIVTAISEVLESSTGGTLPVDEGILTIGALTPLRHSRTYWTDLYGTPDGDGDEFENDYVEDASLYRNKSVVFSSASSTTNDVRECSDLNTSGTADCLTTTSERNVDEFYNEEASTTSSTNPNDDYEVNRRSEKIWDEPDIQDEEEELVNWNLGNLLSSATCDDPNPVCPPTTPVREYSWDPIDDPTETGKRLYQLEKVTTNPAGLSEHDYVVTTYGYDEVLGLRTSEFSVGGFGDYFGMPAPTTGYGYQHGVLTSKWLSYGGSKLLLWLREADEGTGQYRWHLDGAGVGFAYLYDKIGRVTGIAPISASVDSEWNPTISIQQLDAAQQMLGKRIEYLPAVHSQYFSSDLEHTVSDAMFTYDGFLERDTTYEGTQRLSFVFDGLGRRVQSTEKIGSNSYRTRYELDVLRDGSQQQGPNGVALPTTGLTSRYRLSSEWTTCDWVPIPLSRSVCAPVGSVPWSVIHVDGIGRPVESVFPDGSIVFSAHVGDTETRATRSVHDSSSSSEGWYTTTTVRDALGRVVEVAEEAALAPNSDTVVSQYSYDRKDRLVSMRILEPDGTTGQERFFEYSGAGFLERISEPERLSVYGGYDALGNVRTETVSAPGVSGSSVTTYAFDDFFRPTGRSVDDSTVSSYVYGDVNGDDSVSVGDPAYNRIVRSLQNNWFDGDSTAVQHEWIYNGPGGQTSKRTTKILGAGIGTADDGFAVEYSYDQWGNLSSIAHPTWMAWTPGVCDTPVLQDFTYDGAWLTDAEFNYDSLVTGASLSYHPTGRKKRVDFFEGVNRGIVGYQTETADGFGMGRPARIDFYWESSPGSGVFSNRWSSGQYSYDGSGNVSGIGLLDYRYDGLNRLASFSDNGTPVRSYVFDRYGNLRNLGGTLLGLEDPPVTNRLTSYGGVSIDASDWDSWGNLTWIPGVGDQREKLLAFSGEDHLLEVQDVDSQTVWRYAYDAAGERVVSWTKASPTASVSEVSISIRDENGSVLSDWLLFPQQELRRSRDYLYAGGEMIVQLEWNVSGGVPTRRFRATDHLGSTRLLVDQNGTVAASDALEFYPFGGYRVGGPSPTSTHLFTGHERDLGIFSSELDYMHARYYSPNLGRFVSVDPIGGSVGSSQSWNRYSYVNNSPLGLIDPNGEYELGVVGGSAVAVVEAGDTLSQIAAEVDPHGGDWRAIAAFNSLKNPDHLAPGQNLNIPSSMIPDVSADLTARMRANASDSGIHNPVYFRDKVQNGGDWDLKNVSGSVYESGRDGFFVFNDSIIPGDAPGNIHYGYVGDAAVWSWPGLLLSMAGQAQMKAGTSKPDWQTPEMLRMYYGDDPQDQYYITVGILAHRADD